ncbi:MAG: Hpt domain-containing protein [Saprospiraceae bacterium]|nr:Hpt domain-containing protein [Saprospiraceae bacterium]
MQSTQNSNSEKFQFNSLLDQSVLDEVYGGDLEYAGEIFEMVLTYSVDEIKNLNTAIETQDWEATSRIAHKLKPNFSMVGLSDLEEKMYQIEKEAESNPQIIPQLFEEITSALEIYFPIIEKDLQKIKNLLKLV